MGWNSQSREVQNILRFKGEVKEKHTHLADISRAGFYGLKKGGLNPRSAFLAVRTTRRTREKEKARGLPLTCAGHSHDQFLMKREATTRGQTGAQIHSQHAMLLLVPLQILRILRPCACVCVRVGDGEAERREKEREIEKERRRAVSVFSSPVLFFVFIGFFFYFFLFLLFSPRFSGPPRFSCSTRASPRPPALRSLNLYRSRSWPRGVRTT